MDFRNKRRQFVSLLKAESCEITSIIFIYIHVAFYLTCSMASVVEKLVAHNSESDDSSDESGSFFGYER